MCIRDRAHGVSGSRLEARELVAYALKIPPQELYQRRGQYIFDEELDEIGRLRAVRLGGVPLPHIIGPVSYTHLDVYKRQARDKQEKGSC